MATYSNDNARIMATLGERAVELDLVLGYVVEHLETAKETLYAVKQNGEMFARTSKLRGDSFNGKGWAKVDSVPDSAEFIGKYKLEQA